MGVRSTGSHPTTTQADGHLLEYFRQTFGAGGAGTNAPPGINSGFTASGGIISDYTEGSTVYRAHIFTGSGTFDITAGGDFDSDGLEYLVVGGGGGGGAGSPPSAVGGSGGGAGGLRTNLSGHPLNGGAYPVPGSFPAPYTVTIGAGGISRISGDNLAAGDGTSSEFYPPAHNSYPAAQFIRGAGGGGGASRDPGQGPAQHGRPGLAGGGSGGGSWDPAQAEPGAVGSPDPNHPETAGHAGAGSYPPAEGGGGGGGAGGVGSTNNSSSPNSGGGAGGAGIRVSIAGPPSDPSPIGEPGPGSGASATGWFAGGGGGGGSNTSADGGGGGGHPVKLNSYAGGGFGGGAPPSPTPDGQAGSAASGGGGGGGGRASDGNQGGSGIVVVRYKIGSVSTAKATGGNISFDDTKTYHTFTTSGAFEVTSGPISGETLIVAGGGGGGFYGGGGGAGGLLWYGSPTPTKTANGSAITYSNSTTYPITIGAGANRLGPYSADPKQGNDGSDSIVTHPGGPYSATGGGGGGGNYPGTVSAHSGRSGGSAGGASRQNAIGDAGVGTSGQGNDGGGASGGAGSNRGGGGGGAGGAGADGPAGDGGAGLRFADIGSATGAGYPGPGGGAGWFAGGGGGSGSGYGEPNPKVTDGGGVGGPYAGGGDGNTPRAQMDGRSNSGGGGGSSTSISATGWHDTTGAGGSGIVIIAYPT